MSTVLDTHKDLIILLYRNHHFHEDDILHHLEKEKGVISESVATLPPNLIQLQTLTQAPQLTFEKSIFTLRLYLEKWKLIPSIISQTNSYIENREYTTPTSDRREEEIYNLQYINCHYNPYYHPELQVPNSGLTPLERFTMEEHPHERRALGLPSTSTER